MKLFLSALCLVTVTLASHPSFAAKSSSRDKGVGDAANSSAGEPLYLQAAKKDSNLIHGTCVIISGTKDDGLANIPCADTQLILNSADGQEISRTRTGTKGFFKFVAEEGKSYRITAAAKAYEVIAPRKAIQSGQHVKLRLRQKN